MRPLVVGNWKMNGKLSESSELAAAVVKTLKTDGRQVQVVLAPPYTALATVYRTIRKSHIELAGQNCHWEERGAFTGEVSPLMLRDLGCKYVIIGHSERRHVFHETNQVIARKVASVLQQKIRPILCVGETLNERNKGRTAAVVTGQLRLALKGIGKNDIRNVEIAYEPVWAIGTGRNASPEQITQVHRRIRRFLVTTFGDTRGNRVRILYGGSVNPGNAPDLTRAGDVNGFLVGGASLVAANFASVVHCYVH